MTKPVEPVPPEQIFRVLLLRMLETHRILAPYVRYTTSKELKLCHQQNVYTLSEIESWLEDLTEDTALGLTYSAAQAAEMLAGVESSLHPPPPTPPAGARSTPSAPPAAPVRRAGTSRVRSSPRPASSRPPVERTSTGVIVFRAKS